MVSPKGFQSGAIENAEQFDIEIYTLSALSKSIFIDWIDAGRIQYISTQTSLLDYNIDIQDDTFGIVTMNKNAFDSAVRINWVNEELIHPTVLFEREVCSKLFPVAWSVLFKEAKRLGINDFDRPVSIEETFDVSPQSNYQPTLIINQRSFFIRRITVKLKITTLQIENSTDVEMKLYKDFNEVQKGELVSAKFNESHSLNFYKSTDEKEEKAVLIENESIIPLIRAFKINPDTGEITYVDKRFLPE